MTKLLSLHPGVGINPAPSGPAPAIPVTHQFMGVRKVGRREHPKTAPAVITKTAKVIADWEQLRVRTALGTEFKRESRIVLNRPAWMPMRLYRWLLRSIIVDARDVA